MAEAAMLASSALWLESEMPLRPALGRSLSVDVAVIGGGVTGLTAASLLAAAGKSVALLERGRLASAETGHTTAHLTMVTDRRLTDLVALTGREAARASWDAGLAAIAHIHDVVRTHTIDCGFAWVDGYLHAAPQTAGPGIERERQRLHAEAALAAELGFSAEFVDAVPGIATPGVRFPRQARVHPRRYLAGLADAAAAAGAQLYEHSAAVRSDGDLLEITANGHTVSCGDLLLATHNPPADVPGTVSAAWLQTKLALYMSYVVAGRVEKGQVPDGLFWDTSTPYHYMRVEPHADHDMVIFGGEDHKTGQAEDTDACYARLERTLAARVPRVRLTHRWSGQVIETPDGLPCIGRAADHCFVATGFSGNGLTFGTVAGMMAADAILDRVSPWRDVFDPQRTLSGRALWHYVKENADYPYYLVRDRLRGATDPPPARAGRGSGTIVERNGRMLAVYRDAAGVVTERSAICTHLGCVIGWNAAEETWDCPCHGSRFRTDGSVMSGPAVDPLPAADA